MTGDTKNRVEPDAAQTGGLILVVCPCGKNFSVSAEQAGTKVRCVECRRDLVVDPNATTATLPASAAESLMVGSPQAATLADTGKTPRSIREILSPPQNQDEIGRLGPYRILEVLEAGGMGVVFKAEDPGLARLVAVKAMLPSVAETGPARDRFLREARTAASIKNDHIVSIFRVDEDRGTPYLAMEFLEGESLERRLKREGRLPIGDVLRIGREIADGLSAAHELGLIHRDIKPANIWLERRSGRSGDGESAASAKSTVRAKILDFGLARNVDDASITQAGAVIGTPAYMPLEQAHGQHVDVRCDLYSLGVVLYRMATGEMPYQGKTLMTVLAALLTQTPVEACRHDPSIPPGLNALIMRLLSKKAEDRPASASEVYAELGAIEKSPKTAPSGANIGASAMPTAELERDPSSRPSGAPAAETFRKMIEMPNDSAAMAQTGRARPWVRLVFGLICVVIAYVAPPVLFHHSRALYALQWLDVEPPADVEPEQLP